MSDILNGDFPTPLSRTEEYLQAIIKKQGTESSGKDGVTFIPSVSSEGVLSWTNDGELENPTPVNIKGPKGDTGASITAISLTKDSTGAITGGTATLSDNSTITITIEEGTE